MKSPTTLDDLHACLKDSFIALDGPCQGYLELGKEKHYYITVLMGGENASNSVLVSALWNHLREMGFPSQKSVLFWRTRPEFSEDERYVFGDGFVTKEEVQDGAEIPPGYVYDFDTDKYRETLQKQLIRKIRCRLWWPNMRAVGDYKEGMPAPLIQNEEASA